VDGDPLNQMTCWGEAYDWIMNTTQSGRYWRAPNPVSVTISTLPITIIALGTDAVSCAAFQGATADIVKCWGGWANAMSASGQRTPVDIPMSVNGGRVELLGAATEGQHACAYVRTEAQIEQAAMGVLRCWGNNIMGQMNPNPRLNEGGVGPNCPCSDLSCPWRQRYSFHCRIGGQQVWVWNVPIVAHMKKLALGKDHTCVEYDHDAGVECWGHSNAGQTAGGLLTGPVESLCATGYGGCVVQQGIVKCWGANFNAEAGAPPGHVTTPVQVGVAGPAMTVGCGQRHACAVLNDGQIQCWGQNDRHAPALGNRDRTGNVHVPITVTL